MRLLSEVPRDVLDWIRSVFKACNTAATQKLANNPNIQEEFLDLSIIDELSSHSSPTHFDSGWTVEIETHYIGGLHHYWRWEIADIGIMLFLRESGSAHVRKVALLQSKRLYPKHTTIREFHRVDFEIGMSRLADPENDRKRLAVSTDFDFDHHCKYRALSVRDDQYKAIEKYESENQLKVYYSFYNPPLFPYAKTVPCKAGEQFKVDPEGSLGVRVIRSRDLRQQISTQIDGYMPSAADVLPISQTYGWALEEFIVDNFMKCKEGDTFQDLSDDRIFNLFNRRTGAIAAAVSINIEAPGD